ncbi:hypothetical protein EV191_110201 [Tamaricihabitans halophyticus]|uniref:Uncharacterized protein n=1 Tax=Tamaricihabitans halophyticus TaxID=1262583 RepID=A0A4R2QNL2_9PSEU|nr:C4-type zinc ribbon domain-containing protein [Tamaricihabitans halophyticus]TCP48641.1 hypothetical protein EV191_110201 [Tamaricihabitans halophyticus]
MKAERDVQRRLLELAEVDAELDRVDHRRRNLAELTEVIEAEKTTNERKDAQIAIQTSLDDLERETKRQEKDIEAVRAREERDRKLLEAGDVSAKQLADIEHELTTLQRRQSALEDDLLELMEQREAVEKNAEHAAGELAVAEEKLVDAQRRRDEAVADLDTTEARRRAERTELVGQFPAELLDVYEQQRKLKGIGAALLRSRRCGACRLELDRSAIARIAATADDEVVDCEECGAILVRTPESGL